MHKPVLSRLWVIGNLSILMMFGPDNKSGRRANRFALASVGVEQWQWFLRFSWRFRIFLFSSAATVVKSDFLQVCNKQSQPTRSNLTTILALQS